MTEKKDVPTIIIEKSGGLGSFLWGAIVGAAAALLFAPKSGEETQEDLKEGARRFREEAEQKFQELRRDVEEGYEKARADLTHRFEEAREEVRERRRQAEEALRAGREAAQRARGDLERRVAESKASYREGMEGAAAEPASEVSAASESPPGA